MTYLSVREMYVRFLTEQKLTAYTAEYYQPPAYGLKGEPAIPARDPHPHRLSIGYGAGGGRPFKYYLRPNQDVDVGFIKLFILTKPIDLSSIPQQSPFTEKLVPRATRRADLDSARDAWDTAVITVVQRRPASH